MAVTEQTQFSMVEYNLFLTTGADKVVDPRNPSTKEKAMLSFHQAMEAARTAPAGYFGLSSLGGIENIQRVRVLADPATPDQRRFEYVLKLPVNILEQKRQEEKRKAILAEVERLKADPKALAEYAQKVAYEVLGRAATALLLASLKAKTKKPARKPQKKVVVVKKSTTSKDVSRVQKNYEAAIRQDRLNRIEAAKKAAAEFHQSHGKKASA